MPPRFPSSLFPVLYRKMTDFGLVSPLVHHGFLSTRKPLPSDFKGNPVKFWWLVKL
jgi:hypothetical protein